MNDDARTAQDPDGRRANRAEDANRTEDPAGTHRPVHGEDPNPGHPSQAEGEDPADLHEHPDPSVRRPSQAEGEDREGPA